MTDQVTVDYATALASVEVSGRIERLAWNSDGRYITHVPKVEFMPWRRSLLWHNEIGEVFSWLDAKATQEDFDATDWIVTP